MRNQMPNLRAQDGFTMAVVMLVMLVTTSFSLAAYAASGGEVPLVQRTTDSKKAYAAAEAGLAWYLQKLSADNDYWTKCTNVPDISPGVPAPVNQMGANPRKWRPLPSEPTAAYTVELIPVAPATACVAGDDNTIQNEDGIVKIRVTGRAGRGGVVKRSLVSNLRRNGFLDFLYFTDYETGDPTQLILSVNGDRMKRCSKADAIAADAGTVNSCSQDENLATWADNGPAASGQPYQQGCQRWTRDGRYDTANRWTGARLWDPPANTYANGEDRPLGWHEFTLTCSLIQFAPGDKIRGPFHTNDAMLVCGNPWFGRNRPGAESEPIDRVEHWGFYPACNGSDAPSTGNNSVRTNEQAGVLKLPDTNTELKNIAGTDPNSTTDYRFRGRTKIVLSGSTMTVNGASMSLPPDGVIYIENGGSCPATDVLLPYAAAADCGDAYVSGTYSQSLTIATERDVVVDGNVTRTTGTTALLGLIATNFVRVEHRMDDDTPADTTRCYGRANATSGNRTIEAAIMSLRHVFTVDNYQCGAPLGTLTVKGAIAQKYRGAVGTGNGTSAATGFIKDYQYDDRLRFRSPPHFLPPVASAWRVLRTTEQSPAT